ncbi:MAG: L,D-transpeptidase family protein [Candidatus Nanopelagicales bacterium]|nr:L,D-transpeptidase family protein [Candidatus Nanopelagicales bacterium]
MRFRLGLVACVAAGSMMLAPAAMAAGALPQARGSDPEAMATLSLSASRSEVGYGSSVSLSGSSSEAGAGREVIIESSGGGWQEVTTALTQSSGSWSASITPAVNSTIRARMADDSATSDSLSIDVTPVIRVSGTPQGPALVGVKLKARISPASYRGSVSFSVNKSGDALGAERTRASGGQLTASLPTPRLGQLNVVATLSAANGLSGTTTRFQIKSTARKLGRGHKGTDVAALTRKLDALGFHTPPVGPRYTAAVGDAVLAFQKARGLPRTSKMTKRVWRKLLAAKPIKPRYRSPSLHIEVDKGKQLLMVVRGGRVIGALHTSTGATGNTPVGRHRIIQRGGSYLYRFMAFKGNFGIHGYVPVPPYPASHGCVRLPMWAADWVWDRVDYGTSVIVYE